MSRLHTMAFIVRGARLNRQVDALRRRAGLRPYVPSTHLVPIYPLDPAVAPVEHQPGRLAPWLFVAGVTVAFLVGAVAGADNRTANITTPELARCSATLQANQYPNEH